MSVKPPEDEGIAPENGVPAQVLADIEDVKKDVKALSKGLESVNFVNKFVIVVLFAAVIVLLFTAISSYISNSEQADDKQLETQKSLQELQIKYDSIKK